MLAAVGIERLIAYSVALPHRRARVRMALGSAQTRVMRIVFRLSRLETARDRNGNSRFRS